MKIEIVDRELWMARVDRAIKAIAAYRAKEDERYVAAWRAKKKVLWIFPIYRSNKMPPPAGDMFNSIYPCNDYSHTESMLAEFGNMMLSKGTGAIMVDERYINWTQAWDKQ